MFHHQCLVPPSIGYNLFQNLLKISLILRIKHQAILQIQLQYFIIKSQIELLVEIIYCFQWEMRQYYHDPNNICIWIFLALVCPQYQQDRRKAYYRITNIKKWKNLVKKSGKFYRNQTFSINSHILITFSAIFCNFNISLIDKLIFFLLVYVYRVWHFINFFIVWTSAIPIRAQISHNLNLRSILNPCFDDIGFKPRWMFMTEVFSVCLYTLKV